MSDDMIDSIYGLNKEASGKCAYVIISDNTIIATTSKYDLNRYLEDEDCILTPSLGDDILEAKIIYGYVLDPTDLPYELPKDVKNKTIFMLMESPHSQEIEVSEYGSIKEVTEWVEFSIDDQAVEIDDFAIIVGEELHFCLNVSETGSHISPMIFK